jgi:internalin A
LRRENRIILRFYLDPVSRPWRKYLRISVRGLIVLVLVIGAGLGWIVRSARIQREAVAAIENAGGSVTYDWEWSNGKSIPAGKPWAPRWLTDLIGVDYFGRVTTVRLFSSSRASDATLAYVGRLTRLQGLYDNSSTVSDAGFAHFKGLTSLSDLNILNTRVSDAGLAHLKGLTNLSALYLGNSQISDAGLAHLKGLTRLSVLYLDLPHVTDAGLAHLKGMTNVSELHLCGTPVTDAGEKELKQALPRLKIIR